MNSLTTLETEQDVFPFLTGFAGDGASLVIQDKYGSTLQTVFIDKETLQANFFTPLFENRRKWK